MIIWVNGAFGAGKTTLAEELVNQLPDAVLLDPEYFGFVLRKFVPMPPSGDFQDLQSWRRVVVEASLAVEAEVTGPVVVPMAIVDASVERDVLDRVANQADGWLHVILRPPVDVVRQRITDQVLVPDDTAQDDEARQWRLAQIDRCEQHFATRPTQEHDLVLDSAEMTAPELADAVSSTIKGT